MRGSTYAYSVSHDQICEDEDHSEGQHHRLHHRVVPGADGFDGEQTGAGPDEHRLNHHRAGEYGAGNDAEIGQRRNRGIAQSVHPYDAPLRHPFEPCQLDVLAVQHLQHGRAGQPHQRRHLEPAHGDCRQHHVTESAAPRGWKDVPDDGQNPDQHDSQPEVRDRLPQQRDELAETVEQGALVDCGQHPDGNRDQGADENCKPAELQCGREPLPDHSQRRLSAPFERIAQVALEGVADEGQVLDVQFPVEPPFPHQPLGFLRARIVRQQRIHRTAAESGQAKYDHADRQQRDQTLHDPVCQIALHYGAIPRCSGATMAGALAHRPWRWPTPQRAASMRCQWLYPADVTPGNCQPATYFGLMATCVNPSNSGISAYCSNR